MLPVDRIGTGGDCDDDNAEINPLGIEICDQQDNDCDEQIDGDSAIDANSWYLDADNDSYGDPDAALQACDQLDGMVGNELDCDDAAALVNPDNGEGGDGAGGGEEGEGGAPPIPP